jgi:hypothetical protein
MRSGWILLVALLLSSVADATEYTGLWKVEQSGDGLEFAFPEQGFSGACITIQSGAGNEGQLTLESQIVRHRFDSARFRVDGFLDPNVVHLQARAKNIVVWAATEYTYDSAIQEVALDGYELVIETLVIAPEAEPWSVTLCDLTFVNSRFELRFTSDCEGFDFVETANEIRIITDEDWLALGFEMKGGMGLFGLDPLWLEEPPDYLNLTSTFPESLFHVALAQGDTPILEPSDSNPFDTPLNADPAAPYALVVKSKQPIPAQQEWRATLRWQEALPKPTAEPAIEGTPDLITTDTMSVETVEQTGSPKGSGCAAGSAGTGTYASALLLILLLGVVLSRRQSRF